MYLTTEGSEILNATSKGGEILDILINLVYLLITALKYLFTPPVLYLSLLTIIGIGIKQIKAHH